MTHSSAKTLAAQIAAKKADTAKETSDKAKDEAAEAAKTPGEAAIAAAQDAKAKADAAKAAADTAKRAADAALAVAKATGDQNKIDTAQKLVTAASEKQRAAATAASDAAKALTKAQEEAKKSAEGDKPEQEHKHTEETIKGKVATCTENGLTDGKKCSVCGEILEEQKEISALGHKEETVKGKAATCTEKGLTDGKKCSVCGTVTEAQKEISALGHKPVEHKKVDATAGKEGTEAYWECSTCHKLFSDEACTKEISAPTVIPKKSEPAKKDPLSIKSLWASKHSVGKVLFKWSKKDGVTVTGWKLKYRFRKIGGKNSWTGWTNKLYSSNTYEAWIPIKTDYVIEIHAQAVGDTTWSTGIITCPAGGKYHAMKTAHVINTVNGKKLAEKTVTGSAIAHTPITLKVGQTLKVKPAYDYDPGIKDFSKRPRLYPSHMLYDIGDKSMITITKPDGSKYTGGIIDGAATIKATKKGKTTIIFRSPNGRTMIADVTITN